MTSRSEPGEVHVADDGPGIVVEGLDFDDLVGGVQPMMLRLGLTSRVIMESTAASLGTVLGSTILPVTPGSAAEP